MREYYETFKVHELIESGPANNWLMNYLQTKGNMKDNAP
jgi:hypothetical protein